jgi:hypothetical protein
MRNYQLYVTETDAPNGHCPEQSGTAWRWFGMSPTLILAQEVPQRLAHSP